MLTTGPVLVSMVPEGRRHDHFCLFGVITHGHAALRDTQVSSICISLDELRRRIHSFKNQRLRAHICKRGKQHTVPQPFEVLFFFVGLSSSVCTLLYFKASLLRSNVSSPQWKPGLCLKLLTRHQDRTLLIFEDQKYNGG